VFVADTASRQSIGDRIKAVGMPPPLCVEMEGAAVAQVCYEYGMPFSIIRTVSDSANESASIDFPKFVYHIASVYSRGILRHLLPALQAPEV